MYISLTNPARGRTTGPRRTGVRTVSSTVVTLGVVSLLTDISSESVAAVMPLYITGFLGLSTIAFGLLDGLYQGTSALVRIASGYTADRVGRPKWVAFSGYAVSAVARIGLLFVSGFGGLLGVISADRIGKGVRTAPRDALITARSRPDNLATSFSVHRTLDNIGAALGPLMAFAILWIVPDGFQVVFAASLAFAVVALAILGLVVPNVRLRARERADGVTPARRPRFAWGVVLRGPMRRVLAAAGILGLVTIGDGFIYLLLQARADFAALWFPLLYDGTNVAFVAYAIPFGRLADHIGRARVFVFGHLALLGAYAVAVAPVADVAATIACLLLLGAFYATTDGVLAALAAELTTPETRATGIAAAQTTVAIARFAAAAGFGVLWFAIGAEAATIVVALLLAVVIPSAAVLLGPVLRSERGPSS